MIKPDLPQRWPNSPEISYYAVAVLSVAMATIAAELIMRLLHAEAIASLMLCAVIFVSTADNVGSGVRFQFMLPWHQEDTL